MEKRAGFLEVLSTCVAPVFLVVAGGAMGGGISRWSSKGVKWKSGTWVS